MNSKGRRKLLRKNLRICGCCKKEFKNEEDIEYIKHTGVCMSCLYYLDEQRREDNMMQITRDMALDAGDPSLEGQWI